MCFFFALLHGRQIMLAIASSVFFFTIVYDTSVLTAEYAASELEAAVPLDEPEPLLTHLVALLNNLAVYRGVALFNMVVLLLRFFKAFRGQPRLAVITRTFVIAGVDVAHFLLIFFCILMAFVAAAVFLFGQHVYVDYLRRDCCLQARGLQTRGLFFAVTTRMCSLVFVCDDNNTNTNRARYHEWWKALGWCFWSLTGEFFWEEVHLENPTWAIIWWWSYLLVMYVRSFVRSFVHRCLWLVFGCLNSWCARMPYVCTYVFPGFSVLRPSVRPSARPVFV